MVNDTFDISFYNVNEYDYKLLISDKLNFKGESLNYLRKDLVSLYQVMDSSNKSLHSNFNVQMVNCLTVSRLASYIYLKKIFNKQNEQKKI